MGNTRESLKFHRPQKLVVFVVDSFRTHLFVYVAELMELSDLRSSQLP